MLNSGDSTTRDKNGFITYKINTFLSLSIDISMRYYPSHTHISHRHIFSVLSVWLLQSVDIVLFLLNSCVCLLWIQKKQHLHQHCILSSTQVIFVFVFCKLILVAGRISIFINSDTKVLKGSKAKVQAYTAWPPTLLPTLTGSNYNLKPTWGYPSQWTYHTPDDLK